MLQNTYCSYFSLHWNLSVCCSFDGFIYLKYVSVVSILLQIAISRELGLDLIARVFERNPEVADVWEYPLNIFEHVKHCTRLLSNVEMTGEKKIEILFKGKLLGTDIEFLWKDLSCLTFPGSRLSVVRAKRESDNLMVIQVWSSPLMGLCRKFHISVHGQAQHRHREMTQLQESISVTEEDGRVEVLWLKR